MISDMKQACGTIRKALGILQARYDAYRDRNDLTHDRTEIERALASLDRIEAQFKKLQDDHLDLLQHLSIETMGAPLDLAAQAEPQEGARVPARDDADGGWILPFARLARIQAEMSPEYRVGLEEIEAVLLAATPPAAAQDARELAENIHERITTQGPMTPYGIEMLAAEIERYVKVCIETKLEDARIQIKMLEGMVEARDEARMNTIHNHHRTVPMAMLVDLRFGIKAHDQWDDRAMLDCASRHGFEVTE